MKKWIFVMMLTALMIGSACNSKDSSVGQGETKLTMDTKMQKTSYAMGFNMGQNLKGLSPDLDFAAVVQGVKDAAKDESPKISREEIATLLPNPNPIFADFEWAPRKNWLKKIRWQERNFLKKMPRKRA